MQEYFDCNPSGIDKTFSGIYKSVVRCMKCNNDSVTFKPFTCFSVTCESTLKRSLSKNFDISTFDSDNMYRCEKCGKQSKAKH